MKMNTNDDIRYQAYFGDEYAKRYDSGLTAEEMSRKMVKETSRKSQVIRHKTKSIMSKILCMMSGSQNQTP